MESGKLKTKRNDDIENGESNSKVKSKVEFLTYTYTPRNQLYEAVIVGEKPFFLTIQNDQVILELFLEEDTRILRPPALEEYPSYAPYAFKNIDEVNKYIDLVNSHNISLYQLVSRIRD